MTKLVYIELKSGYNNNGPAWIYEADYSKSGQTIYFNGKALKKTKTAGISGNFYDLETGEEYWISGIKKNGRDRHWSGNGKVMIDRKVVDDYLVSVDQSELNKSKFTIVNIELTDKRKFALMENE